MIGLSRQLLERHGGEVPRDRGALESLPGVGRKTANVVLNTAFGEPTIAVDTHIFRVANRTGMAPGADVDCKSNSAWRSSLPDEFRKDAHHWLILHGRYICKARSPECWRCPIAEWCEYRPKTPAPAQASPAFRPARNRDRVHAHQGGGAALLLRNLAQARCRRSADPDRGDGARLDHRASGISRRSGELGCGRQPSIASKMAAPTRSCICRCTWRSPSSCRSTSRRHAHGLSNDW